MTQEDIAELKRQFTEESHWGFASQHGRTGRIRAVDTKDRTLQVDTPRGPLQAKVGEGAVIHQTSQNGELVMTFEDLTPGMLITVNGPTGIEGDTEADEIDLIPAGEGGFRIEPATGPGPHDIPVFPWLPASRSCHTGCSARSRRPSESESKLNCPDCNMLLLEPGKLPGFY